MISCGVAPRRLAARIPLSWWDRVHLAVKIGLAIGAVLQGVAALLGVLEVYVPMGRQCPLSGKADATADIAFRSRVCDGSLDRPARRASGVLWPHTTYSLPRLQIEVVRVAFWPIASFRGHFGRFRSESGHEPVGEINCIGREWPLSDIRHCLCRLRSVTSSACAETTRRVQSSL